MNQEKIKDLLRRWSIALDIGEHQSKEKASGCKDGLGGRIKRTKGQPVIFDMTTHKTHSQIQNDLCKVLPEWSDIIRSTPEIMDGYHWTRNDFIELYFEHFRVVIEKIDRIIAKQNSV